MGRELAARADVVIENFKPGGLARFGLDYESVRAANPGVVYASITGFGSGAGATIPGYDLMVQAMSGLMSLTGDPDGPAYRAGISVFDVMAGLHAAIGILAALRHRATYRRGSAARGQPADLGAVRARQPHLRLARRWRRPLPDGQRAPQPVPLRAAAHRRRRSSSSSRATTASSVGSARSSGCPSSSTTLASAATRTAPPTGPSCSRCSSSGCARARPQEWFDVLISAGVPVRADPDHRRGRRLRRAARARSRRRGRRG